MLYRRLAAEDDLTFTGADSGAGVAGVHRIGCAKQGTVTYKGGCRPYLSIHLVRIRCPARVSKAADTVVPGGSDANSAITHS